MSKKTPEINSGSMADISFLLLTFFLLTSSINTDQGISRKLPPPIDKPDDIKIKERNVLQVLINFNDMLLVNREPGDISTLKDVAKEFLENPSEDINKSEHFMKPCGSLGEVRVSRGVISLQNDRGTSYEMYIKVQNELTKAVSELRDNLSREKFGKKYADLSSSMQDDINKAVPVAISEAEPKNIGGKK